MNRSYLPLISCIALFALLLLLEFYSGISRNAIISIALIMVFLLIFTYALKTRGKTALNVCIIIISFIFLPLFILWYLGIFSSLIWPWGSVLLAVCVIVLGALSIFAMVRLNYVELDFERGGR